MSPFLLKENALYVPPFSHEMPLKGKIQVSGIPATNPQNIQIKIFRKIRKI
jgi:hypothetical protein